MLIGRPSAAPDFRYASSFKDSRRERVRCAGLSDSADARIGTADPTKTEGHSRLRPVSPKVEYYQRAPEKNARYILKTTQPWHQPLERGVYRLFAHNVKINSSNYEMTTLESDGQGFIRENFMPQEDWMFSWETQ